MTSIRAILLRVLLAMLLAFVLWVFVSYTLNPDQTSAFNGVPVEIDGLAPGMVVVDQEGIARSSRSTVDVVVDTDEETLRTLQVSDLRVFVDLTDRGPGEHALPIKVLPTRNTLLRLRADTNPDTLLVRVDREITTTVALTIEVSGSVPFGFEAGAARVTSSGAAVTTVQIRGPQARVARVTGARVMADIDRLTANYNSPRVPEPIAADGQVVAGVTVLPASLNLLIPVTSSVGLKRVPVVAQIRGDPAPGYTVVSVAVQPQLVTLTGSSGELDAVQSIETKPLDVTGATSDVTGIVELIAPIGAQLRTGEPTSALVSVIVAPIDRTFQVTLPVPLQLTGANGGLQTALGSSFVQLQFAGTPAQLAQLAPGKLTATISVRGLGPGTYQIVPTIDLPRGVRLIVDPQPVLVTVTVPATDTPAPTSLPTETVAPTIIGATSTISETRTASPRSPTTPAATTPASGDRPPDAVVTPSPRPTDPPPPTPTAASP